MYQLLYEFKQGNKVLAKIHKLDKNVFRVYMPIHRGSGLGADYNLEANAVLNTHEYVRGLLSIRENKVYNMIHYEYISRYRESEYYKYKATDGSSELISRKYGKTKLA